MKILVIDDSLRNMRAAEEQLSKKNDLTVVGSYNEAEELLAKKHDFEVVLADLLMPAAKSNLNDKGARLVGQEMPIGIFLALLAAKNGAKHVAVFTDSDHHSHPASACFDQFNPRSEGRPSPFTVEGAQVMLVNNRNWVENFLNDDLATPLSYEDWKKNEADSVRVKNWQKLFDYLTTYSEEEQIKKDEEMRKNPWK